MANNEFDKLEEFVLEHIGQFIRERRLSLGLTQEQLAEAANLQANYVTSIETGRKNISILTLHRVLRSLDIDLMEIMKTNAVKPIESKTLNRHLRLLSARSEDEISAIYRITKEVIKVIDKTES